LVLMVGLAAVSFSPVLAQVQSDVAVERAQLQSDRQATVAANLPLTEEQATAFWPMYREYRGEIQKLGDRIVALMLDYAKNSDALSDEQAASMLDEYLDIQKKEVQIKSDWIPKFRKILPSKTVTRFFQVDNKLDAILRYEAVDLIPLVQTDTK